jgi:hypothetical protein
MIRSTLIALLPLVLAACGGPSNDNNGNPLPGASMVIDDQNALQVSQVTYESASTSGDIADLAGSTGITGSTGGDLLKPSPSHPGVIDYLSQVPIGPLELPCAVSGTLTLTADFADPTGQTLSAGDTISTDFSNCDDGVGETLDGTMQAEILAFTGDINSGIYELTMRMELSNFQSTTATEVLLANGDGTATINTLAMPQVDVSVSGESMLTDTNDSTELLADYASEQTLDTGITPSPYTLVTSGTLESSQLDGTVTYWTPVTFEGVDANYPNAGEMLIVGDSSSARLIAQANGIDVVIEIYSNAAGTGAPDSTVNTTWVELAGL